MICILQIQCVTSYHMNQEYEYFLLIKDYGSSFWFLDFWNLCRNTYIWSWSGYLFLSDLITGSLFLETPHASSLLHLHFMNFCPNFFLNIDFFML